MIDAHVHIERGPYNIDWINKFVSQAHSTEITELYFLEHSHRFLEFSEYYFPVYSYNTYQKEWFNRRSSKSIQKYIDLINLIRNIDISNIKIKWGLEVCYLPGIEKELEKYKKANIFDFYTGSIHWIEGWGFDHRKEFWHGKNIDDEYRKYFKEQKSLINSGIFSHLAHPDSIKCFEHYSNFNLIETYYEIAIIAKKHGIVFEQSCGLYNNYGHDKIGLEKSFLKILLKNKIPIVTASDAHKPEDVGKNIKNALNIMEEVEKEISV